MKRIIAILLCIGIFAVAAAGCGGGKQATATGDEAKSLKASDYKNDFNGICTYLSALGYINPLEVNKGVTYTVMHADIIGASKGDRFNVQHEKAKSATVEIYEFDLSKLNDAAKKVIASVEKDNTFETLVGETAKNAYMSDNGKFLMVYTDKSIDDNNPNKDSDNYKVREKVIEEFKKYHANEK